MKLTNHFIVLLGLFTTGFGYILDRSCYPYSYMIERAMASAFDLTHAALATLDSLTRPGGGATWQAQRDLLSFLFSETFADGNINTQSPYWALLHQTLDFVSRLDDNNGHPSAAPPDYRTLTKDDLVLFCDLSRYKENQNCQGEVANGMVCDTISGRTFPMSWDYDSCKSDNRHDGVSS